MNWFPFSEVGIYEPMTTKIWQIVAKKQIKYPSDLGQIAGEECD